MTFGNGQGGRNPDRFKLFIPKIMSTNGYELSRAWFDFCFENPDKINPTHTALFFFAIEHCNRLGWKDKFGFPTSMAMEAIGIGSYNTYKHAFEDLIKFGFIKLIQKSTNKFSANIIALSKNDKATTKALDRALIKHSSKHNDTEDNTPKEPVEIENTSAIELNEWSKEYFHEKYINNKTLDVFDKLIRIDKYSMDDIKSAISFARNDNFWTSNFLSPAKLRNKDKNGVKYIDVFLAKVLSNGQRKSSNKEGCTWEELADIIHTEFSEIKP